MFRSVPLIMRTLRGVKAGGGVGGPDIPKTDLIKV